MADNAPLTRILCRKWSWQKWLLGGCVSWFLLFLVWKQRTGLSRLAACLGGEVALQRPRVELCAGGAVLDEGAALPAVDKLAAVGGEGMQAAVVVARAERGCGG